MTTEIKTWQIVDGRLEDVQSKLADKGRTEAFDLEDWIVSNPIIIGHDLTDHSIPFGMCYDVRGRHF